MLEYGADIVPRSVELSANLGVVVLAGGLSTRFKSRRSKLLHLLAGRPLLGWVLEAIRELDPAQIVVVHGPHGDDLKQHFQGVNWALQPEAKGTADALLCAIPTLNPGIDSIFLIGGDSPLVSTETLKEAYLAYKGSSGAAAMVFTAMADNPFGYGRIVREGQLIKKIVEERDADIDEKKIREVNSGMYFLHIGGLETELKNVGTENAKGEMYLTDLVAERRAMIFPIEDFTEIMGINTRAELAHAEEIVQRRIVEEFMLSGVSFIRPESSYIEAGVSIAPDTTVLPSTYLLGSTSIGEGCKLGPSTVIDDCIIGEDCTITFSQLHRAKVGDRVKIGPYSNVRPDTVLEDDVKLGDFVELKKAHVGKGAKIPHLSYVGDAEIGEGVNVGAGTITCNYDGYEKHVTVIEEGAFIGSNSTIVAPRTIGKGAYIAAGSVITENVPSDDLAVGRGRQVNKTGYAERMRRKMADRLMGKEGMNDTEGEGHGS